MEASSKRALAGLVHSFSLKLVLLALILLSVPLILYRQFSHAGHEQEHLLANAVDQTNRITAALLAPRLANFSREPAGDLQAALRRAAGGHARVKVLVRLAHTKPDSFIYVASQPSFPPEYLKREKAELIRSGILRRLAPTCDGTTNLGVKFTNPGGTQEILTAMTPVHIKGDCWVVISSENAADLTSWPLVHSFWKAPAMRSAAIIYLLGTVLLIWLFFHMWWNVARFRTAARRILLRQGSPVSFRELNTIPELTRVTEDFDSLVNTLVASQNRIRETAQENSHALKTPIAVISQSLEPLKRALPIAEKSATRSIELIERAVHRLDAMVNTYRDLENVAADLMFPARGPLDLSALLQTSLPAYEQILTTQGKHLVTSVQDGVIALASDALLDPVIENLLENAASFTPDDGIIEVQLTPEAGHACLRIMDRGPGIAPQYLPRIFDRAASFRSGAANHVVSRHQGLGLWIVKRNIEALAGTVAVCNRTGQGLEVTVRLQLAG